MSPKTYILEESLGYHVGRTSRTLGALFNRNLAAAGYDVTCEQWSIMVNLVTNNGQNQMDLAAHVCKDKTSITRLINGMEKHSLVVRIPDKDDKRNKLIYLTKKGKDLYQDLLKVVSQTLEQAEKGLETKDLQLCKKTLTAIYNNIVAATTNKKAKGRL